MLIETEHLVIELDSIIAVHFWNKTFNPVKDQDGEWATIVTRSHNAVLPAEEGRTIANKWKAHLEAEEKEFQPFKRPPVRGISPVKKGAKK